MTATGQSDVALTRSTALPTPDFECPETLSSALWRCAASKIKSGHHYASKKTVRLRLRMT